MEDVIRVSAVALRDSLGRVLIARRTGALDGKWEFPGGKLEAGESAEACAVRELREELGLDITITRTLAQIPHTQGDRRLLLIFLEAKPTRDDPIVTLSEHGDARWVYPHKLGDYPLCPADAVFVSEMKGRWGRVIRPAEQADFLEVSRIYAHAWKHAYKGIVSQEYLDALSPDRWAIVLSESGYQASVLEVDGRLIGTSSYAPARDERFSGMGEIISIYILPSEEGKGYGSALMRYVLSRLREDGFSEAYLWTLRDNARARGFYERIGFSLAFETETVTIANKPLIEVRYTIDL